MKSTTRINRIVPLSALTMMLVASAQTLAQASGPSTPTAAGQNPLLGYLIAIALAVLVVVASIMPSKRQSEDV